MNVQRSGRENSISPAKSGKKDAADKSRKCDDTRSLDGDKAAEWKMSALEDRDPAESTAVPEQEDPTGVLKMLEALKEKKSDSKVQKSNTTNNSSALTRRLVNATGQMEVRQIIAQAGSDLVKLRLCAATGKGREAAAARAAVAQMEKLISRASRKIKDLDREDLLKIQKAKAEKKKLEKRAEEIRQELMKKKQARLARENSYLLDKTNDSRDDRTHTQLDAAAEAAISAQAETLAAAEVAVDPGLSAGDVAVGGEGAPAGGDSSAETAPIE